MKRRTNAALHRNTVGVTLCDKRTSSPLPPPNRFCIDTHVEILSRREEFVFMFLRLCFLYVFMFSMFMKIRFYV